MKSLDKKVNSVKVLPGDTLPEDSQRKVSYPYILQGNRGEIIPTKSFIDSYDVKRLEDEMKLGNAVVLPLETWTAYLNSKK